jgi:hypothetical protein
MLRWEGKCISTKGLAVNQAFGVFFWFIRLRQNTLQLAAGMIGLRQRLLLDRDGEATAPQLIERRWVGFGAIPLDTLQFTAGSFI